jgi:DHA2 family multidrug resistance protein
MPLTGWLAGHFGVKYIFLASVVGFTVASALCGAATSLSQLVLYRVLQGVCSAGLVPLGQATCSRSIRASVTATRWRSSAPAR